MPTPVVPLAIAVFALALACDAAKEDTPAKGAKVENVEGKTAVEQPKVEAPARKQPEAPAASVKWTIETDPKAVTLAGRKDMRIRIVATNVGDGLASPSDAVLHFSVDGESSTELALAFNNGGRSNKWQELPPGESVDSSRVGLSVTEELGEHVIALSDGTNELARTTVEFAR